MNWMQVEEYLRRDDRAVLPLGSTEQHAYLSLSTDSVLAERVSADAAEPLGVPVFPVIAYGITPSFRAYPGTVSLRIETFLAIVRDALDSLAAQGFRRVLIVNGHGGNAPAESLVREWQAEHAGTKVKFHNWWNAPQVWKKVQEIDPIASHASWIENFAWTRLPGVAMPETQKPPVDLPRHLDPKEVRERLGDGNYAGRYFRSDEDMRALWEVAVQETRALLSEQW
jgi:creatinine amidohydrolase